MRSLIQAWRDWRWRKSQAPREGWVCLWDANGELIAKRPTTFLPTTEGSFANAGPVKFPPTRDEDVLIAAMTLVDADGNEREIPLHH